VHIYIELEQSTREPANWRWQLPPFLRFESSAQYMNSLSAYSRSRRGFATANTNFQVFSLSLTAALLTRRRCCHGCQCSTRCGAVRVSWNCCNVSQLLPPTPALHCTAVTPLLTNCSTVSCWCVNTAPESQLNTRSLQDAMLLSVI
jgi:hypothetical protein